MKERRIKQQIYYDILQSILRLNAKDNPITITRIQGGSNLEFDKVKEHITSLITYNLLTENYIVTRKGFGYIEAFVPWLINFNKLNSMLHDESYIVKTQPATITSFVEITEILDSLKMQMDKVTDWTKAQEDNK